MTEVTLVGLPTIRKVTNREGEKPVFDTKQIPEAKEEINNKLRTWEPTGKPGHQAMTE